MSSTNGTTRATTPKSAQAGPDTEPEIKRPGAPGRLASRALLSFTYALTEGRNGAKVPEQVRRTRAWQLRQDAGPVVAPGDHDAIANGDVDVVPAQPSTRTTFAQRFDRDLVALDLAG